MEALWVHINLSSGLADSAKWSQKAPGSSCWIKFDLERCLKLQSWITLHCYIQLGDQVWQQVTGIPMGFSCSPQWCNLYFVSYEIKFIQRLAWLQLHHLLQLFKFSYRYIDNLCILNNPSIALFLDPTTPRSPSNPFWIYPLDVVSLQPEIDSFLPHQLSYGLSGHFLNVSLNILDHSLGIFETFKFDKRRLLPFPFQQYIQYASNRPVSSSYNIVISQVVPILYMSSSAVLAFVEIRILVSTLGHNGFSEVWLNKLLLRFSSSQNFPGIRFPIQELCMLIDNRLNLFASRYVRGRN